MAHAAEQETHHLTLCVKGADGYVANTYYAAARALDAHHDGVRSAVVHEVLTTRVRVPCAAAVHHAVDRLAGAGRLAPLV